MSVTFKHTPHLMPVHTTNNLDWGQQAGDDDNLLS